MTQAHITHLWCCWQPSSKSPPREVLWVLQQPNQGPWFGFRNTLVSPCSNKRWKHQSQGHIPSLLKWFREKKRHPHSLSFVVHLESCLLKDIGTPADRLLMGSILVLVWSSLRWSDALWVSPCGLVEDSDIIRGVAAKTKTTSRGTPFAFVKSGLLAVNSQVSWSTKWLNLVRQALQRTSELFPGFKPDFLIPQCGPNLAHPVFSAPLPRSQGVLLLRKLLLQSHRDASVLSVGVHSPKVTLLSWVRQIGASEELRMAQGHHRQSGAKFNVGPIWS